MIKKFVIMVLTLVTVIIAASAEAATDGGWTQQVGDYGVSVNEIAVDSTGNVYVSSNSRAGWNIKKYDENGGLLWTQVLDVLPGGGIFGIKVDGAGNVYVAGDTQGDLDGCTNVGVFDYFVVKYDTDGNKQWTRLAGGASWDRVTGLAVDGSGNAYVAGWTYDSLDGNPNSGDQDIFVVKFDTDGNSLWTRQLGSESTEEACAIALDDVGNVYVTGWTWGILVDQSPLENGDAFVVKYDADGNRQWVKQFGEGGDLGDGIAVDGAGNVYVVEYSFPNPYFKDGCNYAGDTDIFVFKYDSGGNLKWTRQFGKEFDEASTGITIDGAGNLFVAGNLWQSVQGHMSPEIGQYFYNSFVVKYDSFGNKQWTRNIDPAAGWFAIGGITTSNPGDVYLALTRHDNGQVSNSSIMKFDGNTAPPLLTTLSCDKTTRSYPARL